VLAGLASSSQEVDDNREPHKNNSTNLISIYLQTYIFDVEI
jgi:hypothetical protein